MSLRIKSETKVILDLGVKGGGWVLCLYCWVDFRRAVGLQGGVMQFGVYGQALPH